MSSAVKIVFERKVKVLPLTGILPPGTVLAAVRKTIRYRRITVSINKVGVIESLVIARAKTQERRYLLLDGHVRHAILVDLGVRRSVVWWLMTMKRLHTTSASTSFHDTRAFHAGCGPRARSFGRAAKALHVLQLSKSPPPFSES